MLPVAEPPSVADRTPALGWAHREAYPAYFHRLANSADAGAALRRLIPHIDADLDGAERVSLWQALWTCARRVGPDQRAAIADCLDGRHARRLALLDRPWAAPELIEHLAAHTAPASAQAAFVPALLAHHGLDPLDHPADHQPGLVLLAARAALHDIKPRLGAERITQLQGAVLSAAEREAGLLSPAMALLFELALHAGDEATATAVLAELLQHGQCQRLRADRVRAWLDGTAFLSDDACGEAQARPLLLAASWQRRWLQPAQWHHAPVLAALHQAVQRPGPRRRLQDLATLLGGHAPPTPSTPRTPRTPGSTAATPDREALQAVAALDHAYALIDRGGDAVPALRPLLEPDTLAPAAIAAVYGASARCLAAEGDVEGQVLALLQARRQQSSPALRAALAALLPCPAPAFNADWRDEEPTWTALLNHADPAWQRLATFQLATLYTEGLLEPRPPRRCQRLDAASALWQRLLDAPRYAALAGDALRQPAFVLLRPALQKHADVEHLWFETPGACGVTIVFSCIATHHTYAEVAALRGRLPGQHLMFVRCPDKNWYSDGLFERTRALLHSRVARRFAPADVSCWYGSMGGHGALKFALEFGWRAIVFNPQTDLDLWAAFRPRERALLWAAHQHARLDDWPLQAWEQAPLYYACGAATADREALSFVIERLRRCRHLSAIIEKFDDPDHAGLMNRIAAGPVAPLLARIQQRLRLLEGAAPMDGAQRLDASAAATLWDRLDAARALKVELQVRDGQLWWQPSLACDSRTRSSTA